MLHFILFLGLLFQADVTLYWEYPVSEINAHQINEFEIAIISMGQYNKVPIDKLYLKEYSPGVNTYKAPLGTVWAATHYVNVRACASEGIWFDCGDAMGLQFKVDVGTVIVPPNQPTNLRLTP